MANSDLRISEPVRPEADGMSQSALQMQGIRMAYGDGPDILGDIDLELRSGEFVSLIGASGCGKTTLLNLVAGFFQPTGGTIALNGERVTGPGSDRSMVFQDDAVFPWYSVQRNVEYALRIQGIPRLERRRRAAELLSLIGLADRADAYPRELSGGMRKRVDLARALAAEPSVLLMDEPFAALDALTKMRLQMEFLSIWERVRMTVLFVTHDIEEALFMSDRVILMGGSPGGIALELSIRFERPRTEALRTASDFQAMRAELLESLELDGADARPEEVEDG